MERIFLKGREKREKNKIRRKKKKSEEKKKNAFDRKKNIPSPSSQIQMNGNFTLIP